MINSLRESCCCACSATIALRGVHCGVGGYWAVTLRRRWRVAEAVICCPVAVAVVDAGHHCTGQMEMGVVAAAACAAAVRCATLRCAASRPDARCHAPDRLRHDVDATACSAARSAAMRSALAWRPSRLSKKL